MKIEAEAKASLFALAVLVPHPRESVTRPTTPSGTRIGSDSSEGRPQADPASMARCCNARTYAWCTGVATAPRAPCTAAPGCTVLCSVSSVGRVRVKPSGFQEVILGKFNFTKKTQKKRVGAPPKKEKKALLMLRVVVLAAIAGAPKPPSEHPDVVPAVHPLQEPLAPPLRSLAITATERDPAHARMAYLRSEAYPPSQRNFVESS